MRHQRSARHHSAEQLPLSKAASGQVVYGDVCVILMAGLSQQRPRLAGAEGVGSQDRRTFTPNG
jgi:hypothetical protein